MKQKDEKKFSIHLFLCVIIAIVTSIIFFNILKSSFVKQDKNSVYFGLGMFFIYSLGLCFLSKAVKIFNCLKRVNYRIVNNTNLKDISLLMKEYKPLELNFASYKRSLRQIKVNLNEDEILYYAIKGVDSFINEETMIYSTLNIRTIHCLASSLTGIGILGTFYGLITGLEGLNSNEIQSGIGMLLGGVNTSFTTSLLGIILSTSLTFLTKYTVDTISKEISILVSYINSVMPVNNSVEGFKEIEHELVLQTSAIQRLATDLSEQISKQFSISLTETFRPLFENTDSHLKQLSELNKEAFVKYSQTSSENIVEMINASADLFNNNINKDVNALKASINILSNANMELLNNINNSIEKVDGLIQNQENVVSNIYEKIESIEKISIQFEELSKSLNDNLDIVNQYSESYKSIQETQNIYIDNLKDIVGKSSTMINTQKEISDNNIKAQETLSTTLNTTIDKYANLVDKHSIQVDNYSNISKEIVNSMESLNNKSDIMNTYIDKQLDTLKDINTSSEKLLLNMNSNSDLIQYVNVNLDSIQQSNSRINTITEKLYELSILIEKISKLEDIFNTYTESMSKITESINSGTSGYQKSLEESTERVLNMYDSQINKCVNSLVEITEQLDTMTVNIKDSVLEIYSHLNSVPISNMKDENNNE